VSDIKLFRIAGHEASELPGESVPLEKSLQQLIERHLNALLGVHFLASEYSTGKKHGGRIDTLGIDENGVPVIIEHKRTKNENVINQGLFYLDWLLDHRAEFQLRVMEALGENTASEISWENTRLLCIAGDFTKYDTYAVEQINRNIELIRYKKYGDELLRLELVNVVSADSAIELEERPVNGPPIKVDRLTAMETLGRGGPSLVELFNELRTFAESLGDEVIVKPLKLYIAFRRIKNFLCVQPHPQKGCLTLWLKLNPDDLALREGFSRDVRGVGHYGTGDLELTLTSSEDLLEAQDLIQRSYEAS